VKTGIRRVQYVRQLGQAMCLRILTVAAIALVTVLGVYAQTQPQNDRRVPTSDVPAQPRQMVSELAKDNLDRVSASPYQLKAVLVQDIGLLVELKRWIAKEASDNGQVITDEDLTDAAVWERLAKDSKFRAIATRLVQKYGYLKPSINPDSDMGKQQELILKERARKLVQIESQEDQAAQELQRANRFEETLRPCPLRSSDGEEPEDSNCAYSGPTQSRGNQNAPRSSPPSNNSQPRSPEQGVPSNPNDPYLRVRNDQTGEWNGGLNQNSAPYSMAADPLMAIVSGDDTDSSLSENPGRDDLGSPSLPLSKAKAAMGLSDGNSVSDSAGSNLNRSEYDARYDASNDASFYGYRRPRTREVKEVTMVRKSSPYADVPSLYDLYMQAPSRTGVPQRFGAQIFRDGLRDLRSVPMDLPVGPDYVVGPGDSLSIDLWGSVSTRLVRIVDRQGRVALPEAGPVEVSGKNLGEVQQLVQKALASQYRDASAEVSVGRLRTIRVYVVGEVREPGAYDISSLSTPLNALVAAGGVTQRGSLRSLRHFRGRQLLEQVDSYDLLLHGVTPDAMKLENGDTLMVSPVGAQITITGMVRRPAIYELHEEKTLADALELAGGILPAATLKHVEVQRLDAHEKRTMLSLDLSPDPSSEPQLTAFKVKDGDEIHIFPIAPYNQDTIYLQGHVLRPGKYAYRQGMKLTDIVASYKDLLPEPAAHYGEIIRLDPPDFRPAILSFDLASALANPSAGPDLKPLDTVRVFSRFDFEPAPTVSVAGEVRTPGTYQTSGQASLRDAVFLAGGLTHNAAMDTAQVFRINLDGTSKIFSVNLGEAIAGNAAENITLQPRDRLLIHRNTLSVDASTVQITGEVAKPGRYPYTGNMHAADLIRAAGGLKRSADANQADLTRYAAAGGPPQEQRVSLASILNGNATEDVPLRGGDVLAIRQVPGWKDIGASVRIEGEVMHPSSYGIQPGEKLSSVLERAGGYSTHAYPYGTILMRREVREIELQSQMQLISRLKAERVQLKSLPETDPDQKNAKLTAISQTDATLTELATQQPVGRVVIHIQKDLSKWKNTSADVTLTDGDTVLIPKNANTVLVTGQVFNPTAISTQSSRSARWYLSQAGGLTPIADKKAVFVVRADGSVISARNNSSGWWAGDPLNASLRAGDTVVVPEKASKIGGPNWTTALQAAQLASSLALTVAYFHP